MIDKRKSCAAVWKFMSALIIAGSTVTNLTAQFNSGSTGADGALNITAPGTTTFTQTPVGSGFIYNFTTINIASGSTLVASGQTFSNPLYFLAQGAVTINGTLDISGATSQPQTQNPDLRIPGAPGPGGYAGGVGPLGSNLPQPGSGPGFGAAATGTGACGLLAGGGRFTGNQFLVPLVGGSGGGGGYAGNGGGGGSGSGGGGAILIASSPSITVNGSILANGGPVGGFNAGSGSGGAIRLVANSISGTGTLSALAGNENNNNNACGGTQTYNPQGTNGVVRMEAFQNTFNGTIPTTIDDNAPLQPYYASPFNLFLPTAQPSITVLSIGGVPVPANPTGSFQVPDVVVNSSAPLAVQIQSQNVPVGTTVTVFFFSENGPDLTTTATLMGSLASSTASTTVTLPTGYSRGYVKAMWTQ